jgi:tetratricopeptide (TPR) repeat protein
MEIHMRRNLWDLLKEQHERLLLLGSLVALGVGVAKSLLDKADPPVLSLAVFSAVLLGVCGWVTFTRLSHRRHRAKVSVQAGRIASFWIGSLLLLTAGWSFVYREHIMYSELTAKLHNDPRIIVSDNIAWEVLKYDTPAGETSNTLVGELQKLISDFDLRVLVADRVKLDGYQPTDQDMVVLKGTAEQIGLVLTAQMILNKKAAERLITQVTRDIDLSSETSLLSLLPAKRFLRNQFLFSQFRTEMVIPTNLQKASQVALYRLILRFALASRMYYEGDARAGNLFDDLVKIGKLIPEHYNSSLAMIFKCAAFYMVDQEKSVDKGLMTLELAEKFDSEDGEIDVMKSYLLMHAGAMEAASRAIQEIGGAYRDRAAVYELRAIHNTTMNRHFDAIEAYREALRLEDDPNYRTVLHLAIGASYGMVDQPQPREMIEILEDGIRLVEDLESAGETALNVAPFYALQGFAWAQEGNSELAQQAFEEAFRRAPADPRVTYWLGRSLFLLQKYPEAIKELEPLVSQTGEHADPGLLTIFAENLLAIPGRENDAEAHVDRAIAADPALAKAYRVKGMILAAKTSDADIDKQRKLLSDARAYLLKAIRLGDESSSAHDLLSVIYEQSGDQINASKHGIRACELDDQSRGCIYEAERLIGRQDFASARIVFERVHRAAPEDSQLWVTEGVLWYQAGRTAESENAYREALKRDQGAPDAHANLAFVLFDLGRYPEALEHFEAALTVRPDEPDALAGRGITLAAMGEREQASESFALAVSIDPGYLDCELLRKRNWWSDAACVTAGPLMAHIQRAGD